MHPLQNGTQTAEKPKANNPLGDPGYFTESGTDGRPSIPGADYFNAQIDEFKTLLAAGNVEFNRTKFNHILMAIKTVCRGISQFAEYNPERTYFTGEVCFTKTGNEITYWQWYSNQEWIAGKDPLDNDNRHLGWTDTTKPFYWVPYVSNIEGMPFYWLDTSAPEWAVMEINVDLPTAVYWRLARCYPHLVRGNTINTGEIRGEFLRILDQGRGVDSGRVVSSHQEQSIQHHNLKTYGKGINESVSINNLVHLGKRGTGADPVGLVGYSGTAPLPNDYYNSYDGTPYVKYFEGENVTRPSNVARPMAIAI